jgi:hypothetical protein
VALLAGGTCLSGDGSRQGEGVVTTTVRELLESVGLADVAAELGRLGVVRVPREPNVAALQKWSSIQRRRRRAARRQGRAA